MQITLIKDGQNHVHDEYSHHHQDGQIGNGILKCQRLALKCSMHIRGKDLFGCVLDELGCRSDGVAGFQVEEQSHAGELIDVVDTLGSNDRVPACKRAERHHALTVVTLDVKFAQILRVRPFVIRNLQDDLVLVRWLLDQVAVVFGVGVVEQVENPAL